MAGAGAAVSVGIVPDVTPGAAAWVGVRWRSLAVDAQGELYAPASLRLDGVGSVIASAAVVSLLPCLRSRVAARVAVLACARGSLGALEGSSDVTASTPQVTLYALAGARAATEIALLGPLWLRASADLLAVLTPTVLSIEVSGQPRTVWTSPPLAFAGTLGLSIYFR
jgi:hypothetical protein